MTSLSIRKMNELSKKKKKGFTLVELIIVIAIIAILAAIAIPKFGQITRDANIKADVATAKNLHGIAAQLVSEGVTVSNDAVAARIDGASTTTSGGTTTHNLPTPKADPSHTFNVAYNPSSGDITVTVNSLGIYPTLDSTYGKS